MVRLRPAPGRAVPPDQGDDVSAPAITVELTTAAGETLSRSWYMTDPVPTGLHDRELPEWLEGARRKWDRPQDPIAYFARVRAGAEAEAKAWLEGL